MPIDLPQVGLQNKVHFDPMKNENIAPSTGDQTAALSLSTLAFTVCFAVWTIFAIVGVQIQKDLGLSDTQLGILVGTPILTGSLIRLMLGIWTDQFGGRVMFAWVMLASSLATFLLSGAQTYSQILLAALGVGIAGGSFVVGITYVAHWFPPHRKGMAMGVLGMGNAGAAVTKFVAPYVMIAFGWPMVAQVWAAALLLMTAVFWFGTKDEPTLAKRVAENQPPESFWDQLEPLKDARVWRFSLYYFFVFGAFVALALWLPRYLTGAYGVDIKLAGLLAASYSLSASVFRAWGGWLSDRYGARTVMYATFWVSIICCFLLAYPHTDYVIHGIKGDITFSFGWNVWAFTGILFVLGFFMSFGKAAVYKHIVSYYPNRVGAVSGMVGLVGGLGGWILPILFGVMNDLTGIWSSCFMLLYGLVIISMIWMHWTIRHMEKSEHPTLAMPQDLGSQKK